MEISDWFFTMFTLNKRVDKLHWARTIEGHHSDNIFKTVSFKVTQIALHAGRLKLEDAGSLSTLQKFESFIVM